MKRKRILKLFSAVLAAALLFTLAGCGDSENSGDSETINFSVGLKDDGTLDGIDPADYVKPVAYDAIQIPESEIAVSDEALQEQIDELKKEINALKGNNSMNMKKLPAGLSIGDEFQLAGTTWKILDIAGEGYVCLAESIGNKEFDSDDNNWETSKLRSYLNKEFLEKLEKEIGEGNVLGFERNLLSLDGQTEYGSCTDKVSLLTVDEYRKYRKYIPNANKWWWLISPWSTPCNDYSST